jgi:hypothetical protein
LDRPKCTAVPLDDRALTASAGWSRKTGSGCFAGTFTTTTKYGATLTSQTAQIVRIGWVATRRPSCGGVGVYSNGQLITKVNLRSATTQRSVLILLPKFSYRTGKVTLKVLTNSRTVSIDALALSRT